MLTGNSVKFDVFSVDPGCAICEITVLDVVLSSRPANFGTQLASRVSLHLDRTCNVKVMLFFKYCQYLVGGRDSQRLGTLELGALVQAWSSWHFVRIRAPLVVR